MHGDEMHLSMSVSEIYFELGDILELINIQREYMYSNFLDI